jgi:thiamine pyrophosphate-dependent acetolactate synthase large subunit-like protein
MGEAPAAMRLVQCPADVDRLEVADPERVAYLTQTTLSVDEAAAVIDRLRSRFPRIVGPPTDDICYATQSRQAAVRILAPQAQVVLVVGSRNSSNSRRLAELAKSSGVATHLIDGPADIDLAWCTPADTVLISNGFAAMGFALPAAIAASLASRGRSKVVAICGDGGFLMNVQELETAKRLGLPFVVLVWSDGGYGLIEMHQRRKFGRVSGTRFDNPDFVALAQAFGIEGDTVPRAGDLLPMLGKALRHKGPVVLDIPIDYAENDKLGVDLWQLAPEALA